MHVRSENVDSRSRITTRRRTSRKGPMRPTRLFVEELEPRRLLSGGPLPLVLSPEQAAGQSINALGKNLYSLLQGQRGGSGNMFLSPASIAIALAMTDAGARGETASQINSVLHADNADPNTLGQEFGNLLTDLNSAGQGRYALALADALWGQQDYPFNQAFLDLIQADYGGGLRPVDFIGDTEGARQAINDWVAQQTADKIQNLFPPGTLSRYDRLVLTNAIYFKGDWETPFEAFNTFDANFTRFSGDQVRTPTMHDTSSFPYMARDGYQVLEMPYVGGRIAMDVILPSADSGPGGLDVSQLPADLSTWLGGLRYQSVQVSLPKFDMTTGFDLSNPLQALGMTDAFSDHADFSGIGPIPLNIRSAVHKAFVGVSETGTEAAAATGIGIALAIGLSPSAPVVFNADHPFLFVIRDTQSGSVLFEGQVADPTSEAADPSAPPIPVGQARPIPPVNAPVSPPTIPTSPTPPPTSPGSNNSIAPVGPITVPVAGPGPGDASVTPPPETPSVSPPQNVYVNPAWASLPSGTDPDGSGPATAVGVDAFATLQAAIDAAAPGGTVHLAAGTYSGGLNLDKSVILQGAGSATTTLQGPGAGIGLNITGQGATISGLTVTNFSGGLTAGSGTVYLALTDVRFNGDGVGGILTGVRTVLVRGGGGDDTFFVTPGRLAHQGDNPVLFSGVQYLTVDGGGGSNNRLVVFLNDSNTPDTVWLTGSGIARDRSPFLLFYRSSGGALGGGLALVLGDGPDAVVVQGQFAGAPTTVYGGGGDDAFFVGVSAASGYSNLTLDGGAGTDRLAVFDQSGGAALQNAVTVTGQGRIPVTYPGGVVEQILYQNLEQTLRGL